MRPLLAWLFLLAPTSAAWAGPDLKTLLAAADRQVDLRQQIATSAQAEHEAQAAGLALAPTVSATGAYTRNQYEVKLQIPDGQGGYTVDAAITPLDQLELNVTASVPLIDVGAWMRTSAAMARAKAADATTDDARTRIYREVVSAYYQHASAAALLVAAFSARDAAAADRARVLDRQTVGLATSLDAARAEAAFRRAESQVADAQQSVRAAVRTLRSRTGLDVDDPPTLPDSTVEEATLDEWLAAVPGLPSVVAAAARAKAARADLAAQGAAFAPSVSAQAGERVTNAAGFGEPAAWAVGLQARWTLSPANGASAAARADAVRAADAASDAARRDAADAITAAWDRVEALNARAKATVAEDLANSHALEDARAQFEVGTATLATVLDVSRDALASKASRIQAQGDLAAARADLRLLSGHVDEVTR